MFDSTNRTRETKEVQKKLQKYWQLNTLTFRDVCLSGFLHRVRWVSIWGGDWGLLWVGNSRETSPRPRPSLALLHGRSIVSMARWWKNELARFNSAWSNVLVVAGCCSALFFLALVACKRFGIVLPMVFLQVFYQLRGVVLAPLTTLALNKLRSSVLLFSSLTNSTQLTWGESHWSSLQLSTWHMLLSLRHVAHSFSIYGRG